MPGPVAASPAIRIRKGEYIIALAWSNTATQITGTFRVLYDNGKEDDFKLFPTTLTNLRVVNLISGLQTASDDGWILDGQMQQVPGVANQATQRGQCYVKACVVSGIDAGPLNLPSATIPQCKAMICTGYIYSGNELSVGQLIEPGPSGGAGAITRASLAAAGVGAGKVLAVVPGGAIWKWIYGTITYVASGTVGNRAINTRWRDALGNIDTRSANLAATAGQTVGQEFATNFTSITSIGLFGSAAEEFPAPDRPLIAGHDLFTLDTAAIDVADTVALEAQVEEWVMPN